MSNAFWIFIGVWIVVSAVAFMVKGCHAWNEERDKHPTQMWSHSFVAALWPLVPVFYMLWGLIALAELGYNRVHHKGSQQ